MAAKGTANKSSSGASMSKYDVEVEARLIALEAAVAELKEPSHPDCSTTTGSDERVDKIIAHMAKKENIEFTGEDPDADYNVVIDCITEDLKEEL